MIKFKSSLILLLLVMALTASTRAQEPTSAAESAERLRAQLLEVQGKQESLRIRAQQLDEDLKPENIERALAGIGSTRPEELRESRRRQLTIERDGVQAQLKLLETSRSRLETAIANADAQAYQQSARPFPTSASQMLMAQYAAAPRWLILVAAGLVGMALVGAVVLFQKAKFSKR